MKLVLLTALFLLSFMAIFAEDSEEISCELACPDNLENPICLHIYDGEIVQKQVDVDSQCHLDKYKCENKILKYVTSEGPCSEQHPIDNYANCSYPNCVPDATKRCVKNLEKDDVTVKFNVFLKDSCVAQIYACEHHFYHYEITECPVLPMRTDLEVNG